jgi:hypothetical protein
VAAQAKETARRAWAGPRGEVRTWWAGRLWAGEKERAREKEPAAEEKKKGFGLLRWLVHFPFFFFFSLLIQTTSNKLFEFKPKFEFNPTHSIQIK